MFKFCYLFFFWCGCVCLFSFDLFSYITSEDEASYNKKPQLSKDEELYLSHLLTLQDCTSKQKLLCEAAELMYGKKFCDLQPKRCSNCDEGEAVLVEKALLYFEKQMEHFHHSIAQLAVNMGKLAGDFFVILPKRVKEQNLICLHLTVGKLPLTGPSLSFFFHSVNFSIFLFL